jgi:hypothetical protein
MNKEEERKQEGSTPIQARINLVNLATLDIYWTSQRYRIRTMSQLVSWSIDLLCSVLKSNGVVEEETIALVEAHRHLEMRGLYQRSMKEKGFMKLGAALRFEAMREEGVDPKEYVPTQYNIVHNVHSVKPPEVKAVKRSNFGDIKFIPLDEYPEYVYPEGDEATRDKLLAQLKDRGIESVSEKKIKAVKEAEESGMLAKE